MVARVPVECVADAVKLDRIQQSIYGLYNLLAVVLRGTVGNGQRTGNEVVLDVNHNESADGSDNLQKDNQKIAK